MNEANSIYRRFILIDKEKEQALLSLIEQKRLTPDDLMLILSSVKINPCLLQGMVIGKEVAAQQDKSA